jgi:large exoprotein involved in heme utilization and adhesion
MGNGGNLTIETGQLFIQNGAVISNATLSSGSGGTLEVNANESVELSGTSEDGQRPSLLTAVTTGIGNAGDLTIETGKLIVRNGGNVSASSSGQGEGGTLDVTASEFVEVIGRSAKGFRSALTARTAGFGDTTAGNLRINTGKLFVRDGARVSVSGHQARNAGDLQLKARSIQLDNQGSLIAETESGNGGNIRLQDLDLLLLRRNSQISTQAGTNEIGGGGNGGDITINTDLLVALPWENSDIIANAFDGRGGNVRITTQGVFGLERRSVLTPLSEITAFSQQNPDLNGVVEINTPDINPSRGLDANPAQLVDASELIVSGCGASRRQGESKFIVTGRGGLPMRPGDAYISPYPTGTVRSIPSSAPSSDSSRSSVLGSDPSTHPTRRAPTQIMEAQGWIINNKGEVVLTATAPTVTPHILWSTPAQCHAPETSS